MGRDEMRAADADRQAVADKLRVALDEGRLDLGEYDERLQRAYAAKTYGELDPLLSDLAVVAPDTPADPYRHATARWLGSIWGDWARIVMITSVIWAVICIASGELQYYWPVWVGGPLGLILILQTIGGLSNGAPSRWVANEQRKELLKQRKEVRRALEAQAIARGELPPNPTLQQRKDFEAAAVARGELPPKPAKLGSAR